MATSPTTICNIALAEGLTRTLINGFPPTDNSPAAVTANLFYTPKTQMLLRAANWDFARRQSGTLTLLRAAVVNGAVSSDPPPQPFQYQYLLPPDCLKARFLIQYQQPQPTGTPIMTGPLNAINPAYAVVRIPFVIAADVDPNTHAPRKTLLTNMQNAMLVYTCDLSQSPDMWDSTFLAAETAMLAGYFIAALSGDKGLLLAQNQIAKSLVEGARAINGNEAIANQDHIPDWIQARWQGSGYGWSGGGYPASGQWYYGWDACELATGLFF